MQVEPSYTTSEYPILYRCVECGMWMQRVSARKATETGTWLAIYDVEVFNQGTIVLEEYP